MDFRCRLSQLYELPEELKSTYQLEQAVYTAMTMDHTYWKKVLTAQAGFTAQISDAHLFRELERTQFVVQYFAGSSHEKRLDPDMAGALCANVFLYQGSAPCFHAKLAVLKYTAPGKPDYYRLGIFSKNLTDDGDDQNGVILYGFCGEHETDNGEKLWAYLQECSAGKQEKRFQPELFRSIKRLQLPQEWGCEIHFNAVAGEELWPSLSQQTTDMTVVCKSQFVGGEFRSSPAHIEIWNQYDGTTDKTHMKLYLLQRGEGETAAYEYWSGSANCSSSALIGDNVECLVKLPVDQKTYDEIKTALKTSGYAPQTQFAAFDSTNDERGTYHRFMKEVFDHVRFLWQWDETTRLWQIQHKPKDGAPALDPDFSYTVSPYESFEPKENTNQKQTARSPGCAVFALWEKHAPQPKLIHLFFPEGARVKSPKECLEMKRSFEYQNFLNKRYIENLLGKYGDPDARIYALKMIGHYNQIAPNLTEEQQRSLYETIKAAQILFPGQLNLPPEPACPVLPERKAPVFQKLKEYQFSAACYIVEQLKHNTAYTLADEAGMGKTYVALEVIGQLFRQHCAEGEKLPFNVYYMCSNQRILEQNSSKLLREMKKENISAQKPDDCDRLSMAFQPLTCQVALYPMSSSLLSDTYSKDGNRLEKKTINERKEEVAQEMSEHPKGCHLEERQENADFQQNRMLFQAYSLCKNPPKLILLDEFHRMNPEDLRCLKGLLRDFAPKCKLLYISATPFRMSLEEGETAEKLGDGEVRDSSLSLNQFLQLVDADNRELVLQQQKNYHEAIRQLQQTGTLEAWEKTRGASIQLEQTLRKIICRNERGRLSDAAKPEEFRNPHGERWKELPLARYAGDCGKDVCSYQRLIPGVGSYQLFYLNQQKSDSKYKFEGRADYLWSSQNGALTLREEDWNYNPYLATIDEAAVAGFEQLLWVPPVRPDYLPPENHPFAKAARKQFSKLLIFSGWNFIPRAVSSIFSRAVDERNGRRKLEVGKLGCSLAVSEVKALAQAVPRSKMIDRNKPLPELVQELKTELSMSEDSIYQALGSPEVCLYRLLDEKLGEFAREWVQWAQEEDHLLHPDTVQDSNRWNAYFYASQSLGNYAQMKKSVKTSEFGDGKREFRAGRSVWVKFAAFLGESRDMLLWSTEATARLRKKLAEPECLAFRKGENSRYSWDIPEDKTVIQEAVRSTLIDVIVENFTRDFETYFNQPSIRLALAAAGVQTDRDLTRYCAAGNLQAVLEEWFFIKENVPSQFFGDLHAVLRQEPGKVHIQTEEMPDSGPEMVQECLYAQRYTDDKNDTKEHNETWQNTVQAAFNSPFWPMILTTTSIAQEGLDFHCYCRKLMHYTLPVTPMAMEQREGRIDRFRGYIQRLRQAAHHPRQSWDELFSEDAPGSCGIIPNWVVPPEQEDLRMERITGHLPHTQEALRYAQLLQCKRQYRSMLGMPNDTEQVENLLRIAEKLGRPLGELFPNLAPLP